MAERGTVLEDLRVIIKGVPVGILEGELLLLLVVLWGLLLLLRVLMP